MVTELCYQPDILGEFEFKSSIKSYSQICALANTERWLDLCAKYGRRSHCLDQSIIIGKNEIGRAHV